MVHDPTPDLPRPILAVLCSNRCPGGLVVKFYDLARRLRDEGIPVMGGFHTPMEREALDFLVRGNQPVVWVPSWSRSTRGLSEHQSKALSRGTLRIASIFDPPVRRPSKRSSSFRNRWIVERADLVLVVHATEGGLTFEAAAFAVTAGPPLFVLADPSNESLSEHFPRAHLGDQEELLRTWAGIEVKCKQGLV